MYINLFKTKNCSSSDSLEFSTNINSLNRIRKRKSPFVVLRDDFNNPVTVCLNKTGKNSRTLSYGTKTIGCCDFSECCARVAGDNYPEYYKNMKYLFINSLSSTKKYKGIGTELVKEIVRESYKRNMGGRVCLTASSTKAELHSPVPFYYKLGFKSVKKDIDEKIEKSMKSGLPLPKECESTTMFLPQNKIKEILMS